MFRDTAGKKLYRRRSKWRANRQREIKVDGKRYKKGQSFLVKASNVKFKKSLFNGLGRDTKSWMDRHDLYMRCSFFCFDENAWKLKLNSVALVRERTIPTERPPLLGEVSANWWGCLMHIKCRTLLHNDKHQQELVLTNEDMVRISFYWKGK
jgi:hypothetical protein